MSTIILSAALASAVGVAAWLAWQLLVLRRRFRPIVDIDAEVRRAQAEAAVVRKTADAERAAAERDRQATLENAKSDATAVRKTVDAERAAAERNRQATLENAKSEAIRIVAAGTTTLANEIEHLTEKKSEITQAIASAEVLRNHSEEADAKRRAELEATYKTARDTYVDLKSQVSLLEENLEDISYGLYKPHYGFATSAEYQKKFEELYERQKKAIHDEAAVSFGVAWSIGDSRAAGLKMQKQYGKLMLRAFNGECDAAIARVSWSNVTKMEERIKKAFEAINSLGGVMQISLTSSYLSLQMEELHLTYELEQKKHAKQEEEADSGADAGRREGPKGAGADPKKRRKRRSRTSSSTREGPRRACVRQPC